jgi:hypothetical protein
VIKLPFEIEAHFIGVFMRFKTKILIVFFALAILSPVLAQAMGETSKVQKTSRMCDMSGKTQKFVLTSKNEKVKETFKVPVRYMSMELERWGKINTSLHLLAHLETLSPSCQDNGWPVKKEESFTIQLNINARPEHERKKIREKIYSSDKYEDIEIEGYPGFTFKSSKDRPKEVKGPVRPGGYLPTYPKEKTKIPVYFHTQCEAIGIDIRFLNMCRMSFLYQNNIAATIIFHSSNLPKIDQIYFSSIELIKKFHVK